MQKVMSRPLILLLVLALAAASQAAAQPGRSQRLSKHDRQLLAEARAKRSPTVTLLIAARSGAFNRVVSEIASLGGVVGYTDSGIGYVRATVPTGQVEAVAALPGVEAVDLNEIIPLEDPRPGQDESVEGVVGVIPQPPPGPATPIENPYMPIGDTKAAQFMADNPTWDGRGVTVGIVDSGISLDHPSLLTTSTGEAKVVDWVTATDPFIDSDPTWLDMSTQVSGSSFSFAGTSYTAPAAGSYRIALLDERDPALGGELGNDLNRDGNPAGSQGSFAVLWDTASNLVYVDTNQNDDFRDDLAMTDYRVAGHVGYFGVDNPATPVAERLPFVVQTDGQRKVVNIGIVSGSPWLARRRDRGRQQHVRRRDERGSAGRKARLGARLPVRRGLHRDGPDRRHDLRRQAEQRRRDQHVDRRAARAQ